MKCGDWCYRISLGQVQLGSLAHTHSSVHPLLEEAFFKGEKVAVSFSYVPLPFLQGANGVVGWYTLMCDKVPRAQPA